MLIKCPECGNEISDRAEQCIHCGFPLSAISQPNTENSTTVDNKIYRIATHGYVVRGAYPAIEYLKYLTGEGLFAVEKALKQHSPNIVSGLTYEQAVQINDTLQSMNVNSEICKDEDSTDFDPKWNDMNLDQKVDVEAKNIIKCPRCGSTAVSVGNRGVTLTSGFFGASKTMNRCGNCGHKWKPR